MAASGSGRRRRTTLLFFTHFRQLPEAALDGFVRGFFEAYGDLDSVTDGQVGKWRNIERFIQFSGIKMSPVQPQGGERCVSNGTVRRSKRAFRGVPPASVSSQRAQKQSTWKRDSGAGADRIAQDRASVFVATDGRGCFANHGSTCRQGRRAQMER